ncbi:PGF-CTERM sorting domain-containing protein [Halomontanus rarus]|uniref:PGF-CTERM sorting domain-containing protein n=1 Tax=Halomontanus rarus TaxID=3034020 RepID=UPI0023E8A1EB|nr:PGF-CTERM sorting domain-containing protein [Halovivax sp. TS33]
MSELRGLCERCAYSFCDVETVELSVSANFTSFTATEVVEVNASSKTVEATIDAEAVVGDEAYEALETAFDEETNELVATTDRFSQFTVVGTDDRAPVIDDVTVDPASDLVPADGPAVLEFEYSPEVSAIDVSETTVDVDVPEDRVETQITDERSVVRISALEGGESITVELTVVDEAGNDRTVAEQLAVTDESDDTGDGGGIVLPEPGEDDGAGEEENETDPTNETSGEDGSTDGGDADETGGEDESTDGGGGDARDDDDNGDGDDDDGDDSDDEDEDGDGTPGFGTLVALAALLTAMVMRLHERDC